MTIPDAGAARESGPSTAIFIPEFVPNRLRDLVARYAVLTPLRGKTSGDEEVKIKTISVLRHWRSVVDSLHEARWAPVVKHYDYIRNCRPNFIAARPATRCCRMQLLCPWCYSRWVQSVYARIDTAWPDSYDRKRVVERASRTQEPAGGRGLMFLDGAAGSQHASPPMSERNFEYRLITWSRTYTEDNFKAVRERLENYYAGRIAQHFVRMHQLDAGLNVVTVVPTPRGQYLFRIRWLAMLHNSKEVSETMFHPKCSTHVEQQPTRMRILKAVAQVCEYPRNLLTARPDQIMEVLDLLKNRKTRVVTGLFRNVSTT